MASPVWFLVLLSLLAVGWGLRRMAESCRRAQRADWGAGWLNFLDGLNRIYCRRVHDLDDLQLEIPDSGPAIVVSNHVSGLDPLMLIAASHRPLRFLVAREQYVMPWFSWRFRAVGCIPVDRQRRPERALREALKTLQKGEVVALFPHGKIHLDSDPPRKLKPGAAKLAQATGAPLIPVRITGVRGEGHVLPALFFPSRIEIHTYPVIECSGLATEQILERLTTILNGRVEDPTRDADLR